MDCTMYKLFLSLHLLCFLNFCYLVIVKGYNLAPEHALLYNDPSEQIGSYFGYSIGLQTDTKNKHWLVVGAPRGNSTQPSHLDIREPGMVYQCRIGERKCVPQLLDSAGNDRNDQFRYEQHKDNAWIGGSVDVQNSTNGKVLVCGHRWMNYYYVKDPNAYINGICYVTSISNQKSNAEKLLPLIRREDRFQELPSSGTNKSYTYYFAFGQGGMSTHFTKEGNEMLIGAPGVYSWTGTVIKYDVNNLQNPVIPNPMKTPKLMQNFYFGYSLASVNFGNKTYYVSGAPRAGKKFQGKVYIFDFHVSGKNESKLNVARELPGEQIGEYFGAAICVEDVNGDGVDEILVGAPRYSSKKTWDEGRIFILYIEQINDGNVISYKNGTMQGSKKTGAQYGTAISSLGDIDNDGFNDIAVGAPYEESGSGVIYIYYGSIEGPRTEDLQRIVGKNIESGIRGFGISFTRGVDVDGNNYTDFAVGAHLSGQVVLIKSQPVILYNATLHTNVTNIVFDVTNFLVTACISYTGKHVTGNVGTNVTIILDRFYQRVEPSIITNIVNASNEKELCMNHSVEIKHAGLQDFSKSITLEMQYRPHYAQSDQFCKRCPVAHPKELNPVRTSLIYNTGCKSNRCRPDLNVAAEFLDVVPPLILGSQQNLKIRVTVANNGEPAFLTYVNIAIPMECSVIRAPNCEIIGEKKKLKCLMGNPLKSKSLNSIDFTVDLKDVKNVKGYLEFNMTARSTGDDVNYEDNFLRKRLPLRTVTDIIFEGEPNPEEIVFSRRNESVENDTTFFHTYKVKNLGPSSASKLLLEFKIPVSIGGSDIFIEIEDTEGLKKCQRSDKPTLRRQFIETEADNTTDYDNSTELEVTTEDYPIIPETEPEITNVTEETDMVENVTESQDDVPRERSRSTLIPTPQGCASKLHLSERTWCIDCLQKGVKCITVQCEIHDFARDSVSDIVFRLKVDFQKLVPYLNNRDIILYTSSGKATVDNVSNVKDREQDRSKEIYVITTFHGKITTLGIDLAILGASIGGAILFLIILIFALWKFGFFKRKRPEETYKALKQNKQEEERYS